MMKLQDYWYIAAASSELRRRPIRRLVEGETLVLFRDSHGRPWALTDRCAHRGMALSAGKVVGECIECPYHGWQYDGGGRVRAVPALCDGEPMPELLQPPLGKEGRGGLRSFPVAERDQHVWVWIGDGASTREPFHFPYHGEPGWHTFFMHTRFAAPVEACLENFLDVPHTLFVHPGLFRGAARQPTRARIRRFGDAVEAEFLNEQPMQGWGPRLVFPRDTVMRHMDRFLLPSISRVDYWFGDKYAFLITSQCTQREEHAVDVTTAITWKLPLPGWAARPFLRWYCRRVIQQDVDALRVLGEQIRRFGQVYTSTSADLLGQHIRTLRRRAARGAAVPEGLEETAEETVLCI